MLTQLLQLSVEVHLNLLPFFSLEVTMKNNHAECEHNKHSVNKVEYQMLPHHFLRDIANSRPDTDVDPRREAEKKEQ